MQHTLTEAACHNDQSTTTLRVQYEGRRLRCHREQKHAVAPVHHTMPLARRAKAEAGEQQCCFRQRSMELWLCPSRLHRTRDESTFRAWPNARLRHRANAFPQANDWAAATS